MSELSELIKINRNIERQNDEIIRLLKRIAGEGAENEMTITYVAPPQHEVPDMSFKLDGPADIGEVYFVEERDVFRLTVKNNEMSIDNLTGSHEACHYAEQELLANESVKLNRPIGPATVILNKEQSLNLPETLRICCEIGAGFVYMPLYCVDQLVGAPEALMALINLAFYKDEDELIQKVFGGGD